MRTLAATVSERVVASILTVPKGVQGWLPVLGITAVTTISAGMGAAATGFVNPSEEFSPPTVATLWRPLSAFVVPGLLEELIWRAAFLPTPSGPTTVSTILQHAMSFSMIPPPTLALYQTAITVLMVHVCSHPVFSAAAYPRGREVFSDPRFLFLATIVLGGTTLSYIVSGGSVWAAALTHGLPVALWRDFFGGEDKLQRGMKHSKD